MPKKISTGNKTDRYINLILKIANTNGWLIHESKLKELLGHPSKSQFYNLLNDLTTDSADRPAILFRIVQDDEIYYKLHDRTWENFFIAKEEGEFLLQCHKKLGYLIESGLCDIDLMAEKSTIRANLNRKFVYLSAVQGKEFNSSQKNNMQTIIKGLISENKLRLNYSNKVYTVLPISLCQYRDDLYLVGYKDDVLDSQLRVFKVLRIESIETMTETFSYPSTYKWDPKQYFKDTSGIILGERKHAVINVYGYARAIFKEKDAFSNKLLLSTEEYDQYECIFTSIPEFLGQLFVYANEIEIKAPDGLKNDFVVKAKAALKLNAA
ncbi:WYL domain-containing protein [Bacteriovoracaceae bacterium]|nr:WYL domain-containing protein [Bacteriovoracaceae bacterium]